MSNFIELSNELGTASYYVNKFHISYFNGFDESSKPGISVITMHNGNKLFVKHTYQELKNKLTNS